MSGSNILDELGMAGNTAKKSRNDKTNSETTIDGKYEINDADRKQKNLLQVYRNEERIPVRVAPSYASHFGRVMKVAINGVSVSIPCDGKAVMLPETFAAEVYRRMSNVDAMIMRASNMSNFQRNSESTPGSLNFFG